MEEKKLNELNDEELNEVAGGMPGDMPTIDEPPRLMWCDDCKKNVNVHKVHILISPACPECGGWHISEPRT